MKEKAPKVGRPPVKDKKVAYVFMVRGSEKKQALKNIDKEVLDSQFRNLVTMYSENGNQLV